MFQIADSMLADERTIDIRDYMDDLSLQMLLQARIHKQDFW